MGKTAKLVMKLVAAGLAFAALVCLIIGSWSEIIHGCEKILSLGKKDQEDADYDEEYEKTLQ